MGFRCHAKNDAVCATSAARECPVEIGVLIAVRQDVVAAGGHNFPLKDLFVSAVFRQVQMLVTHNYLVSSHAMKRSQSRVSTALTVTACNSDCWAGASDYLQTLIESSRVDFEALHTSTQLDSLAAVVLVGPVLELNILEMMHPQAEGTRTSTLAVKIMPRVACIAVSSAPTAKKKATYE